MTPQARKETMGIVSYSKADDSRTILATETKTALAAETKTALVPETTTALVAETTTALVPKRKQPRYKIPAASVTYVVRCLAGLAAKLFSFANADSVPCCAAAVVVSFANRCYAGIAAISGVKIATFFTDVMRAARRLWVGGVATTVCTTVLCGNDPWSIATSL